MIDIMESDEFDYQFRGLSQINDEILDILNSDEKDKQNKSQE